MTYTVTVSEFRQNLSHYLELLRNKAKVTVTDGRKGDVLVKLTDQVDEEFDMKAHLKWAKNLKPVFTDNDLVQIKANRKKSNKRLRNLNW